MRPARRTKRLEERDMYGYRRRYNYELRDMRKSEMGENELETAVLKNPSLKTPR